jgi:hypothetical protein
MSTESKLETAKTEVSPSLTPSKTGKALVFVSHDSRDATIAEAFSKLLSSVSAGVLKSFRSSDKKGTQGIEYGVDWYPEVMRKLDDASDVVCLLTPFSVNRPWILYEAGVAKGQLNTPVHGLALGIPLADASTGPFAQFQNSDDDTESITSLVMQLVSRIPNAEPDREVVINQVETFNAKVAEIIKNQGHEKEKPKKVDDSSVAKLFEEIKLMYQDLPSRIESKFGESPVKRSRTRRMHPMMMEEMMDMGMGDESPYLGLLMWLGLYRAEFPWLYDLAYQLYQAEESDEQAKVDRLTKTLVNTAEMMRRNPMFEGFYDSKEHFMLIHELPHMLDRILIRYRKNRRKPSKVDKVKQDAVGHPLVSRSDDHS